MNRIPIVFGGKYAIAYSLGALLMFISPELSVVAVIAYALVLLGYSL